MYAILVCIQHLYRLEILAFPVLNCSQIVQNVPPQQYAHSVILLIYCKMDSVFNHAIITTIKMEIIAINAIIHVKLAMVPIIINV